MSSVRRVGVDDVTATTHLFGKGRAEVRLLLTAVLALLNAQPSSARSQPLGDGLHCKNPLCSGRVEPTRTDQVFCMLCRKAHYHHSLGEGSAKPNEKSRRGGAGEHNPPRGGAPSGAAAPGAATVPRVASSAESVGAMASRDGVNAAAAKGAGGGASPKKVTFGAEMESAAPPQATPRAAASANAARGGGGKPQPHPHPGGAAAAAKEAVCPPPPAKPPAPSRRFAKQAKQAEADSAGASGAAGHAESVGADAEDGRDADAIGEPAAAAAAIVAAVSAPPPGQRRQQEAAAAAHPPPAHAQLAQLEAAGKRAASRGPARERQGGQPL